MIIRCVVVMNHVKMSVAWIFDQVFDQIRIAVTAKERQIKLHGDFWANEGYSDTKNYRQAIGLLKDAGFQAEFFYEERQFVDMYTIIKW